MISLKYEICWENILKDRRKKKHSLELTTSLSRDFAWSISGWNSYRIYKDIVCVMKCSLTFLASELTLPRAIRYHFRQNNKITNLYFVFCYLFLTLPRNIHNWSVASNRRPSLSTSEKWSPSPKLSYIASHLKASCLLICHFFCPWTVNSLRKGIMSTLSTQNITSSSLWKLNLGTFCQCLHCSWIITEISWAPSCN